MKKLNLITITGTKLIFKRISKEKKLILIRNMIINKLKNKKIIKIKMKVNMIIMIKN